MTNEEREVMRMALKALEDLGMKHFESTGEVLYKETFTAIKEALAQPEQEPVYWQWRRKNQPWSLEYIFNSEVQVTTEDSERRALYTTPPQRKPLTEWRPIETAPKNESILVWGKWFAYPFQAGFKNGRLVTAGNVVVDEATHWMPLPDAPIEAAHGIKGEA